MYCVQKCQTYYVKALKLGAFLYKYQIYKIKNNKFKISANWSLKLKARTGQILFNPFE